MVYRLLCQYQVLDLRRDIDVELRQYCRWSDTVLPMAVSHQLTGILEFQTRLLLYRRRLRFNQGVVTAGPGTGETPQYNMEQEIREVIGSAVNEGRKEIGNEELWETLGYEAIGVRVAAGKVLRRLGVINRQSRVKGYWYDLSRVPEMV